MMVRKGQTMQSQQRLDRMGGGRGRRSPQRARPQRSEVRLPLSGHRSGRPRQALALVAALAAFVAALLIAPAIPTRAQEATATQENDDSRGVRFEVVDIFVNTATPLAAYQFEIVARHERTRVVGVEGGEPEAFQQPPYYDPAALRGGRVIIAAFSMATELPAGRVRVASVHFAASGGAEMYDVKLVAAAGVDGTLLTQVETSIEKRPTEDSEEAR